MIKCISCITSAALFPQRNVTLRSSLYGIHSTCWRSIQHGGFKVLKLNFWTKSRIQCFSARRARTPKQPKVDPQSSMEESGAFYVVRKGDIVGIYKSFHECQLQASSSVCDPSVSVFKGYSLSKDAEEYLSANGLKSPLYTIKATDAKEDLFGALVPCPIQEPVLDIQQKTSLKRSKDQELAGSDSTLFEQSKKHLKLGHTVDAQAKSHSIGMSCIIEFDGASKGNPGKAGAGAILRREDGSLICQVREGLGIATNNVAEYRALLLGMKCAIQKGYKNIHVQGDSMLVCNQVNSVWDTKNENMAKLCKEVKALKSSFLSFSIRHVRRPLEG